MQVRSCRDFIPDSGRLTHLRLPTLSDTVRVDAGFISGDEVSSHYDPMIAKLIVGGPDRASAVQKLKAALEDYEIAGPITNIEFLKRVCQHPSFIAGDVETGFIPKHRENLFHNESPAPEVYAQAALGTILREAATPKNRLSLRGSASGFTGGFQNRLLRFSTGMETGGKEVSGMSVQVNQRANETFDVFVDGTPYLGVKSHWDSDNMLLTSYFPHTRLDTRLVVDEGKITIFQHGTQYRLQYAIPKWMEKAMGIKDIANSVLAPMPCKVLRVLVAEGDSVAKDQALVVIESMKMETTIRSPQDGIISRVVHGQGVSTSLRECKVIVQSDFKFRISAKLVLRLLSSENSLAYAHKLQ